MGVLGEIFGTFGCGGILYCGKTKRFRFWLTARGYSTSNAASQWGEDSSFCSVDDVRGVICGPFDVGVATSCRASKDFL